MEDNLNLNVLKEKIKTKEYIDNEFFNIFNKIKSSHFINPLFIHILKLGLNKYNNIEQCSDINIVGFNNFPGLTIKEKQRNLIDFDSEDAFVFYVSYNEDLINKFYAKKQLLPELLDTNEFKTIINNDNEIHELKLDNIDNISIKSESFHINEDENVKNEYIHNKAYLNLVSGHNFEYNCITFLLNGFKNIKYLPRVVFYPITKAIDMEEIDSAFIVEDLIEDAENYFHNFQSIDFKSNTSLKRNKINIEKNDLIFVEIVFCHPSKTKLNDFMDKIIKFLKLYNNAQIIDINQYKVKPILIFDNNYVLKTNEYNVLKNELIAFQNSNKNFIKSKDIVDNMQICYGWPTLSIFNNFVSTNELKNKINSQQNEISSQQKQISSQQKQISSQQKQISLQQKQIFFLGLILCFVLIFLIILLILNIYKK